jgi:hypothetical protein
MCLRNIALKNKLQNLLADKLITIMVFVQFCDIKKSGEFLPKISKNRRIYPFKNPNFSQFFVGKTTKFVN